MKQIEDQAQIDEMRKRLYDRGAVVEETVRHQLSDVKVNVSRDWTTPSSEEEDVQEPTKPKRHYRSFLLIGSSLIFIIVTSISGFMFFYGGNQISSDNIEIAFDGPSVIGGGEELAIEVAVSNQNIVPIESATLILRYPTGTRSIGDIPRNLFEERIPIEDIEPGTVKNIPISVIIFGEENTEKQIEATIEYRVDGSNGVFYKDAEALAFRINSSPLALRIDNIEKVASGQMVDITMTAVSNASTPLSDVLITASYPNGFTYESSNPVPIYGQNVWRIDELMPEESTSIKIQGIVSGLTEETFRINFTAGPENPDNQYLVGATLAEGWADYVIERPFIDVAISIDGDKSRDVVLSEGADSSVIINITNTLDETVYDMAVEVVTGGNALNENSIQSSKGFYDSNTDTVRWGPANNSSFSQILPGDSRSLEFKVVPGTNRTTSSYDLVVNVYARRVAESSAVETLIGTLKAEAKYSSSVMLGSQVNVKTGSIPPQVGKETTYTLTMVAEAGANDVTGAIVETSLPVYVNWLDEYDAEGEVTYNSVSKKLQWAVGDISSGQRKEMVFPVSILPSASQIRTSPVLLNGQSIRANDRFTSALLQDSVPAVTTRLSSELGYAKDDGEVIR
jgi:hypothetical protein